MELLERLNGAMDYIEENICDEMDIEVVAQIACCSSSYFVRMFSYIAGMSLYEYVRRRRLSLAALELQNSNVRIIDLAIKYGYDAPDAFTRAFQKQHGVTPTMARETGIQLKNYPKLTFHIQLKGDNAMKYKIVERGPFEMIGKGIMVNQETVGEKAYELWQQCGGDGTTARMQAVAGSELAYGVTCYRTDKQTETWSYHVAYEKNAGSTAAEGTDEFETLQIPALTWVVFESTAPMHEAIKELWGKAYSEWFPSSGYTDLGGPEMEVYHPGKLELWIAIKKL